MCRTILWASSLAGILGVAHCAHGRIITSFTLSGETPTPVSTPAPNNGNVAVASANQVALSTPLDPLDFDTSAPHDTVIAVQPSGGATEYFFSETVANQTGHAWSSFTIELGRINQSGTYVWLGSVAFLPEIHPPRFDNSPPATATAFATMTPAIFFRQTWSSGLVLDGGAASFTFSILTPDDMPAGSIPSEFILRQMATPVPEPGSIELTVVAAVFGVGVLRRRRGRVRVCERAEPAGGEGHSFPHPSTSSCASVRHTAVDVPRSM